MCGGIPSRDTRVRQHQSNNVIHQRRFLFAQSVPVDDQHAHV
ncbi:hypothetical protein ACZ87_00477 [Candidatus Erwinia dacicola]|uniref:Uncharacterized protein n=1 Tax=Candidatus Erwinia dacicola TaxID=252393 RepID=A0A328TVB4_9GAMM|nr:hypothetical protein ACZ87_00477 [Candidatus Erwinia dacicola]